jgi:hypothetical protein
MAWTFYNSSGEALIEDGAAVAATQAEMETATATGDAAFVTPGRTHFHPGVAKAWVNFHHPEVIDASYNITSITDHATTGQYTITIATDFSAATYARVGMAGTTDRQVTVTGATAPAAGTLDVQNEVSTSAAGIDVNTDAARAISIVMFGDQ